MDTALEVLRWPVHADLGASTRRVLDPTSGTDRLVAELDGTIVGDLGLRRVAER